MFSTVRGIVSRPRVTTRCSSSQSTAVRTIVFPTPPPWRSGRTASGPIQPSVPRSEEHTSELQSQSNLVCRLLLEKQNKRLTHPALRLDVLNFSTYILMLL